MELRSRCYTTCRIRKAWASDSEVHLEPNSNDNSDSLDRMMHVASRQRKCVTFFFDVISFYPFGTLVIESMDERATSKLFAET